MLSTSLIHSTTSSQLSPKKNFVNEEKKESTQKESESARAHSGNPFIHKTLYEKVGVIALIEALNPILTRQLITQNKISFGEDFFFYSSRQAIENVARHSQKVFAQTDALLQKLRVCSNRRESLPTRLLTTEEDTNIIYKQSTHNSIHFFPFTVSHHTSAEETILRIFPWLSKGTIDNYPIENLPSSGFEKFTFSFSTFGASLQGEDKQGTKYPLLSHKIQALYNRKIIRICDVLPSFYEATQFATLNVIILLMKKLGKTQPEIVCSLDYTKHLLFGLSLYFEDKITRGALGDFFQKILQQRDTIIARLNALFTAHNSKITITSPFESVFGFIPNQDGNKLVKLITDTLALSEREPDAYQCADEEIITHCLALMTTRVRHPKQAAVWHDFLAINPCSMNTARLENFFALAEAVSIIAETNDFFPHEACSIQPYSAIQTQKMIREYIRKSPLDYPILFFITYFDLFITFCEEDFIRTNKQTGIAYHYTDTGNQGLTLISFFKPAVKKSITTENNPEPAPLQKPHINLSVEISPHKKQISPR